jgi:hypothetical protein
VKKPRNKIRQVQVEMLLAKANKEHVKHSGFIPRSIEFRLIRELETVVDEHGQESFGNL